MVWLWRVVLVAVALMASRQIVVHGMAEHHVARPGGDGARRALDWNPNQPHALLVEAQEAQEPDRAQKALARAVRANPARAEPFLALARLAAERGEFSLADAYVEHGVRLRPASPQVLTSAARHWLSVGRLPEAVSCVFGILAADSSRRDVWFPVLRDALADPVVRPRFAELVASPPQWWSAFLVDVSEQARDIEKVRDLFRLRGESAVSITPGERRAFVARLIREGLFPEAHQVWSDGLDDDQRAHLGLVYDGGFELGLSGEGFDWRPDRRSGERVVADRTYGMRGERALHWVFLDDRGDAAVLTQTLLIAAGNYSLSGMVRPEMPDSKRGVRWTLHCLEDGRSIGGSERFQGVGAWTRFVADFSVPDDCVVQELRLGITGAEAGEQEGVGGIWFDDLSILENGGDPEGGSPMDSETMTDSG